MTIPGVLKYVNLTRNHFVNFSRYAGEGIYMNQRLLVDNDAVMSHYPNRPFLVRHNLVGHPLFEIPRLLEVEKALPPRKVSYVTGKVGVNEDKYQAPPTGLTAEETIRRIRDCESWLVLKNVELIPEYRELLAELLGTFTPLAEKSTPGVRQLEAWIFVTSPRSISPYHLDPEHNFLLQIHGNKVVHVFDADDPGILSNKELEDYYTSGGTIAKLEFKDVYQQKARTFALKPGEGVHIPYKAPHWVQVEDEFSISFSITFFSNLCDRQARLYRFNSQLRKLGLNPVSPGRSALRDAVKDGLISGYLKTRKMLGKKAPAVRQY